jgi:hypothetical protein
LLHANYFSPQLTDKIIESIGGNASSRNIPQPEGKESCGLL